MAVLCEECIKHPGLKRFFDRLQEDATLCPVCGNNAKLAECDDSTFSGMFRSLLRYFFSETAYNPHLGGDSIEHLLFKENEITNFQEKWDRYAYEAAILEIIEPAYYDYDKGISLYAGYTDGFQNPHLIALRDSFDDRLYMLKSESLKKNYFVLEDAATSLLADLARRVEHLRPPNEPFYRARIGYEARAYPLMGWAEERHYRAYENAALGAPPPPGAGVGRMNRAGVSFLYVATNADTAIAEIRPHPGHSCSVGVFTTNGTTRIADLSALDVCSFSSSDEELDEFLLLKSIDDLFSMPITPEKRHDYNFTQLLADTFRHLGFDGVCYRSSVGEGQNFVFFDPSQFSYRPDSARVVKVKGLNYTTADTTAMGADDLEYMTRPDGSFL